MRASAFEVQYSYVPLPDKSYRYNGNVLVVTDTVQRAIELAEAEIKNGHDVRVHQVIRRGAHDVIIDSQMKEQETE